MIRKENIKVLGEILQPLRKSQKEIINLVVQGIASMAQAASIAVASFLTQATGSQLPSALTSLLSALA